MKRWVIVAEKMETKKELNENVRLKMKTVMKMMNAFADSAEI